LPGAPGTCPAERALVLAAVVDWRYPAACKRPWCRASAEQIGGFFTHSFWLSAHFRLVEAVLAARSTSVHDAVWQAGEFQEVRALAEAFEAAIAPQRLGGLVKKPTFTQRVGSFIQRQVPSSVQFIQCLRQLLQPTQGGDS